MPIEYELPNFLAWLPWAVLYWLIVVFCLTMAGLFVGFLVAAVERGPAAAAGRTIRALKGGLADLFRISPRRVGALARLAVKESIRRRVVVVFAVFILVLLFAGWFLDPGSPEPSRLYLSFVLTATSYLVLLLALFLSAFSLPIDIRTRTLHTVVTKPVRPSEIVLGRMLGFTIIGTGLLAVMGAASFVFVTLGLSHNHTLAPEDLKPIGQAVRGQPRAQVGETDRVHGHRHRVYVDPSGKGLVETGAGHYHELTVSGSGSETRYTLGSPQGMLVARVPVYGKMRFRDRDGLDATEGINVGDEWMYRGYIQGGSPAALIWTFEGIREESFPEEFPVEMNIGVFRTHKGNIEKGVLGSIAVRNPETGLKVEVSVFESTEFGIKRLTIPRRITEYDFANAQVVPRKIETPDGVQFDPPPSELDPSLAERRQFDLYEDLVADGKVEIWLRCLEPGQYFGAAQADLYLRAKDAPFWFNFVKGYFGIWLQMVLVIAFGVMFSTFLSGAIAMIATLGTLVGGFFVLFMSQLARGEVHGGGPLEALIRLVTQENLVTDLGPGLGTTLVKMFDTVMEGGLWVISSLLPAFGRFSFADYVAYGFDISPQLVLIRACSALAFVVPTFVAGYFFLKTREVAR